MNRLFLFVGSALGLLTLACTSSDILDPPVYYLDGIVVNAGTKSPLAGVEVFADSSLFMTTDDSGWYSVVMGRGSEFTRFSLTFVKTGYETVELVVPDDVSSAWPPTTSRKDVLLTPTP